MAPSFCPLLADEGACKFKNNRGMEAEIAEKINGD
jgi:hypothetical protein